MSNPASTPDSVSANPAPKEKKEGSAFRDTLNLPQTAFAMKANLVQNEPASIKRWAAMNLYQKIRDSRAGAKRFTFHDGPPYANGSIHLGHLMNKVLKDMVVRSKTMAGFDCPYVPGWDCHGLPIEHKVMTELVEKGKMEKLKTLEEGQRRMIVRRECKAYAEKFHKLHTQQFSRLMTLADYEHPYLTMQPAYEGATLEVLADLLDKGLVYRALKPIHWSIANETALAEAELEYYDREDLSVYVDFEAASADAVYTAFGLKDAVDDEDETEDAPATDTESARLPKPGVRPGQTPCFMIWTTTPWTLPANLAIAVNPKFEYGLYWVDGNITILAKALSEKVFKAAKAEKVVEIAVTTGDKLLGLSYRHPFVPRATHADNPKVFSVMAAEYVTLEDGTGLVHTAPGHGQEDYATGLREKLPIYCPVRADGTYDATVPEFLKGKDVWTANKLVTEHLRGLGNLFYDHTFTHSYPHDWRSKTPTIFRCTEQWFVGVDRPVGSNPMTLRELALSSVAFNPNQPPESSLQAKASQQYAEDHGIARAQRERTGQADGFYMTPGFDLPGQNSVRFVPEWGRNRMRGMLEARPDWCISRQRSWGLPIPAFLFIDDAGNEQTLMTGAMVKAIAKLVREKGSDVWFEGNPEGLLVYYDAKNDPHFPANLSASTFVSNLKKGGDILDVWFESGSSWNAVMRERNLGYPAHLYLEGSDQHRGWFQLSLLPALGMTGQAPFKTLLTHGFMVDKDGRKLSKSKGDSVEDLFTKFGVDVLRWWVSSLAYDNDVKVDESFFAVAGESYRKVRNTLKHALGLLGDYKPEPGADLGALPETSIDAWALAEFEKLAADVKNAYEHYEFKTAHARLYEFCDSTLSSTYFVALKDRLYCDRVDSPRRRRAQAVLFEITDGLCRLLAPIMVHTADEAYRSLYGADKPGADKSGQTSDRCVHLEHFLATRSVKAHAGWKQVFTARDAAMQTIEQAKKEQGVENPLDMGITFPDGDGTLAAFDRVDLADLLGVSRVHLDKTASEIRVADLRGHPRCERSWKRDGTVKARSSGALLSDRDAEALGIA